MAKRFRDTGKWRGWYRELPTKIKLLFDYICDECDHAGIFKEDYAVASLCIGERVTRQDLEKHLSSKVIRLDEDKVFIPSFVEFQYSLTKTLRLNPDNKAHCAVIKQLERHGIDPVSLAVKSPISIPTNSTSPLENSTRGLGKGKEEGEGIGNGEGGVGGEPPAPEPDPAPEPGITDDDFESVWKLYPLKLGKSEARLRFHRMVKTRGALEELGLALARFREHHAKRKTDPEYYPHFTTFLGVEKKPAWRDWLDPETGTSEQLLPGLTGPLRSAKEQSELEDVDRQLAEAEARLRAEHSI